MSAPGARPAIVGVAELAPVRDTGDATGLSLSATIAMARSPGCPPVARAVPRSAPRQAPGGSPGGAADARHRPGLRATVLSRGGTVVTSTSRRLDAVELLDLIDSWQVSALRPYDGKATAEVHDYHDEQVGVLACRSVSSGTAESGTMAGSPVVSRVASAQYRRASSAAALAAASCSFSLPAAVTCRSA